MTYSVKYRIILATAVISIATMAQAKNGYKSKVVQAYYINKGMASKICDLHFEKQLEVGIKEMCVNNIEKRVMNIQFSEKNISKKQAKRYCKDFIKQIVVISGGFLDGGYKRWELHILGMDSVEGKPDAKCKIPISNMIVWDGEKYKVIGE